jgi:hypothetical protein
MPVEARGNGSVVSKERWAHVLRVHGSGSVHRCFIGRAPAKSAAPGCHDVCAMGDLPTVIAAPWRGGGVAGRARDRLDRLDAGRGARRDVGPPHGTVTRPNLQGSLDAFTHHHGAAGRRVTALPLELPEAAVITTPVVRCQVGSLSDVQAAEQTAHLPAVRAGGRVLPQIAVLKSVNSPFSVACSVLAFWS